MKKVTLGDLNAVLTPNLYKQIAKILVPEKDWVNYKTKDGLIRSIATDKSEIYHQDFGFNSYEFKPQYWNASTGYTFCEEIIDINEKMSEIFKLIRK